MIMIDLGPAQQLGRVVIALAELAGSFGRHDRNDARRGVGALAQCKGAQGRKASGGNGMIL